MKEQYSDREFYANVRWFEPNTDKIKRMKFGIVIACIMILFAIMFCIAAFQEYSKKLAYEERLVILIYFPILPFFLIQLVNTFKIMNNRLGFDGEMVYLKNYNGKILKCRPSELVYSGKILAAGKIFIYIKDRYFKPLYPPETMREIESILSQAKIMKPFKFDLSYVIRNGNFSFRLYLIYAPIAMILIAIVLLMKLWQN